MKRYMLLTIMFFLFLATTSALPKKVNQENFICISLGANCTVARRLDTKKLRSYAFPFDWLRTPQFDSIILLLKNSFKDFLNTGYLIANNTEKNITVNTLYDITFTHDFENYSTFIAKDLGSVQEKYNRRINRLYETLRSNKHVYFMRSGSINSDQITEFCQTIKELFPHLRYTFVVATNTSLQINSDLKNVKLFLIKDIGYPGNTQEWQAIFKALQLKGTAQSLGVFRS